VSVYLLLGAIINIAVAWACICWSPFSPTSSSEFRGLMSWRAPVPQAWPDRASHWQRSTVGLTEYNALGSDVVRPGAFAVPEQWVLQAGWPKRSMFVSREIETPAIESGFMQPASHPPASLADGLPIPAGLSKLKQLPSRYLPTRPHWPGFAANTLLYAFAAWSLCGGPWWIIRKQLRKRRNQCPACGYPRGTSPICTECGAPLPARATQ
jgi:hypothetical protein